MEHVLGDQLLLVMEAALEELVELEDFFFMNEKIFILESDMRAYKNVEEGFKTAISLLKVDEIRGITALEEFRKVVAKNDSLYYRLVESGHYPKLHAFYNYDENEVR